MTETLPALEVPADVVLRRHQDRWLFTNLLLRSHVEVAYGAIPMLLKPGHAVSASLVAALWARDWTERYIGRLGLHSDPSGMAVHAGDLAHGTRAVELLRKRRILVAPDSVERDDLLRPLATPLDRSSLGSFHQRVAQTNLLYSRSGGEWLPWHDQKFSATGAELLPGPYRDIQFPFVRRRLATLCRERRRVLDFGCGNGFFSGLMADFGAMVVGIDSSEELLQVARANHPGCEFRHVDGLPEAAEEVASLNPGSLDLVFLQDTYLLLRNGKGAVTAGLASLLDAFTRALAPGGLLVLDEPDPDFWLAMRLGDGNHPIAVLSDAGRGVFEVAPGLDEIVGDMSAAGFAMVGCDPILAPDHYPFERAFPAWRWLEFVPVQTDCWGPEVVR